MMKTFLVTISLLFCVEAFSEQVQVTDTGIFYRCYSQVTGTFSKRNSSILNSVKKGEKDPVDACLEVLDKARFTSAINEGGQKVGAKIQNIADVEALNVVRTMHNLHFSWFNNRTFPALQQKWKGNVAHTDVTAPALYYTKALLYPNEKFSSIVRDQQNLRAIRSDPDLNANGEFTRLSPFSQLPKHYSWFKYYQGFTWAPTGDLWGVRDMPNLKWKTRLKKKNYFPEVPDELDLTYHRGGGALGSLVYLTTTVRKTARFFRSDGAVNIQRIWGREVFNDFLCRGLPVVRESTDVIADPITKEKFVRPDSSIPFRNSSGCVSCHVSMDRLTSVIRDTQFEDMGGEQYSLLGGSYPYSLREREGFPALAAETEWPHEPDVVGTRPKAAFWLRPTNGTLYYRSWDGKLINQKLTSISDLGAKLSNQDGIYVCAAKRYYEYFTGISVSVGDVVDPAHPILSASEKRHRSFVIQLGLELKEHQSSRMLIQRILKSTAYRNSIK